MVKNELETGGISAPNIGIASIRKVRKIHLLLTMAVLLTLFLAVNGATPASSCTDAADNNSLENDTLDSNSTDCKKDNVSSVVPDVQEQPIASDENVTANATNVSGAQIDPLLIEEIPVSSGEAIASDAEANAVAGPVLKWANGTLPKTNMGEYGRNQLKIDSSGYPKICYQDQLNRNLMYFANWNHQVVDSVGDVGFRCSIALDSSSNPHISYVDYTNRNLKYARWTGTAWNIQIVDSSGKVHNEGNSLALDSAGNPHISYYAFTDSGALMYAKWTGSAWNIQTVDKGPWGGQLGWSSSLAIDSSNNPHISYYDYLNGNLKYAKWTGSAWNIQTVDSWKDVGGSTSLALDSSGNPHIGYYDWTNLAVKYAKWNGSAWNIQTVGAGSDISIALDSSDNPHIAYKNSTRLIYAKWTGSAWNEQTVDDSAGSYTSIALDSYDNPYISYSMGSKYAQISEISRCTKIFAQGLFTLTSDIIDSTENICIQTNSGVVLDGQGHTIDGMNDHGYGIYYYVQSVGSSQFNGSSIKDLKTTDWEYGIYGNSLYYLNTKSYIFYIERVISNSNFVGIFSTFGGNISNSTVESNNRGIYTSSANIINSTVVSNNIGIDNHNGNIINSTVISNNIGIVLAEYGNISNNNVTLNGVGIKTGYNSNITNNIVDSNRNGIILEWFNNTLNANLILRNKVGLNITSTDYTRYNYIYNNHFDNDINVIQRSYAKWNVSIQENKNIIGGHYFGGNFWANDGYGFSQLCNDKDRDGICDSNYTINSNNIDYLPLADFRVGQSISSCIKIANPGVYTLTADIVNSTENICLKIVSSDVVLDGQGHTIDGVKTISTSGVRVYNPFGTLTNVTVKNLNLSDWDTGIDYKNTQNGSIENNFLRSNSYGVLLGYSTSNKLINNTANSNTYGMYIGYNNNFLQNNIVNNNSHSGIIISSENNTLINNSASYNRFGFFLQGAENTLSENIVSYNSDSGISINYYYRNNIINNIVFNNGFGIYLKITSSNIIDRNEIFNNSENGIHYLNSEYGESYNNFTNNIITGNKGDGIHLDGEEFSLISGNTINSNNQGIYIRNQYNPYVSVENTIRDNFIERNIAAGINLSDISYFNLIYNNFFNNSINAIDESYYNKWEIEKTNISNIVGGPYQGGNYWSDYEGEDIDGDFLGDTLLPYDSGGYMVGYGDYKPLIPPVIPCGAKITTDTILNTDVLNCRATGIEIAADDITLDCNGYTLSGSEGSNVGVHINGRKNAEVRNCTIRNFYTGILAFNSTFANITNNVLENNQIGLSSQDVHNNAIMDNRISSNARYGVRLTTSSDNTMNNNVFESNVLGLYFSDQVSYYNIFENNSVNGDIYYHLVNMTGSTMQDIFLSAPAVSNLGKISVIDSSFMTIKDLTLANNNESGAGIFLYSVNNSDLSNITVSDNTYGIRLESSGNNSVIAKAIRNNYGIYLDLSSENRISDSNLSGNYQGLYLGRSYRNTVRNLIAGNNYNGILLSSSSSNTLQWIRSYDNFNGMLLENLSSDNKITGINSSNNRIGIRFENSAMNRLFHSSIIASDQYDFFSSDNSLNNILNLTINRNIMSFAGYDISLRTPRTPPPDDKRGWIYGIGRYLDVGNNSNNSWAILNLSYVPSDLGQVRETSLGIHRFDRLSGDWNRVPGTTVNANGDYVSANITTSGTFGISGLIRPTRVVYKDAPCITGDAFYTSIRDAVGASIDGERIVVCPGNYLENTVTVDKSLDIQSYTGVNGTSVSVVSGDILKVTASNVNITGLTFKNAKDTGAAAIRISGSSVTVSGNIFDSNSDSIFISGYNNKVSNNSIIRNTNAGIELGTGSHNNDVTGNTIATNSKGLLAGSSTNNTIRNNTIRDNDNGIHLVSSDGNSLKFNIFNSNNNGIYLFSSSFNKIVDNVLDSHNVTGILVERSSNNNSIKNNSLQMNKQSGIRSYLSMNNEISYNRLKTSINGIHIGSSNNSNILQNVISNSSNYGIYALWSHHLAISNNSVTQNFRGINIENSYLNEISYNAAKGNTNSSIRLETSRDNNISSNTVSTTKHGIYLANSWNNTIYKNLAFLNYQAGITLAANSINNNISNNDINSNTLNGIYVLNSNHNSISDNSIYGNEFDSQDTGITLNFSKDTTIYDNFIGNHKVEGIFLTMSADSNVIRNNTIQDNQHGMWIEQSNNNLVYQNNFLSNSNITLCDGGARICQAYDNGYNYWNTSTIGNHWSDYDYCTDNNSDNICDYPYEKIIDGTDWHPYATYMQRLYMKTSVFDLDKFHRLVNVQIVNQHGFPLDIPSKKVEFVEIGYKMPPRPGYGFSAQQIETSAYSTRKHGSLSDVSAITDRYGSARTIYRFDDNIENIVVTVNVIIEGLKNEIDIPSNYEFPDIFMVTPQYQKYFLKGMIQNNELKVYSDWGGRLLPERIDFEQTDIKKTMTSEEIYSDTNPLLKWTQDGTIYPRTSITKKGFDMGLLPPGANPMTITAVSSSGSSSTIQGVYWIILEKNKNLEGPDGMGNLQRSDSNTGYEKGDYATYSSSITLNRDIINSHINEKISSVILDSTGRTVALNDNAMKMIKDVVRNTRNYDNIAQNIGDGLVRLAIITEPEKQNVIDHLKESNYSVIKTLDWLINNDMILLSEKWLSLLPYYDIPSWIPYIGGRWGPDLDSLELTDNTNFITRDGTASSDNQGKIILRFGSYIGDHDLVISGANAYNPQGSQLKLIEKTNKYYVKGIVPSPYVWDFGVASVGLYVDYYADLNTVYLPVGESLELDHGSHYTYGNSLGNGKIDLPMAKADFNIAAGHGLGFELSRANGFQVTNFEGIVYARFDWKFLTYKDHWGRKWTCNVWPVLEGGDVECWAGEASEPEGWRLMDRRYVNEHYSEFVGNQAAKEPAISSRSISLAQVLPVSTAPLESSSPTKETLLIRNVFDQAEPQLALNGDNDNMMMVYVYDDITKNISQALEIFYTRWNGSQWSQPSAITSDLRMDVKPDIVYDTNGNAFAAWVAVNNSSLTDTTPLNETIKYTEIAYSKFDRYTNEWTEPEILTHNQFFDYDPLLASGNNGKIMSMWYADEDNQISVGGDTLKKYDMNKTIYYSVWNGSSWRSPAVAFSNIPLSNKMEFAFTGDTATAVWGQDTDGNSSTDSDREVMYSTWNGNSWTAPYRFTDNAFEDRLPTVIYDGAEPLLAWESIETTTKNVTVNNTNKTVTITQPRIYYATFNGAWSQPELLTETNQVEQLILTRNPQNNPVLLWQSASVEGTDIFYSVFDKEHNSWGAQKQLTSDFSSDVSYSPVITSNNDIISTYVKTEVELVNEVVNLSNDTAVSNETFNVTVTKTGNSSIYFLTHHIFVDLEISDNDITLSNPDPAPGEIVTINANVRNVGDLTLNDIMVRFSEGGSEIETQRINSIGSGRNKTVSVLWRIPETNISQDIYVEVDPINDIVEENETNNLAKITMILPDIALGYGYVDYTSGRDVFINTTIGNPGHSSAKNISVGFYYSDSLTFNTMNRTLIKTVNISDIEPDSYENASIVWNPSSLQAGYYYVYMVADPDNKILETDETNNEKMLILKAFPDIAVSDLVLNDIMEGDITFNLSLSNQGTFDASDVNLKVFGGLPFIINGTEVELNESLVILNVTTPLIRANENITISGIWNAQVGDHEVYSIADPDDLISERDEFNNIGSIRMRILQKLDLTYLDAVDTDADGLFDHIRAEISARIKGAWNYYLTGLLNGNINLSSSNLVYLEPGVQRITLNFSGIEIREKGLNGPFTLKNVTLYDETGIMGRLEGQYNTPPLDPANFETLPINLTYNFSDSGIDTDGDKMFNYLAVYAGVNVTKAGTYIVHGSLFDTGGNFTDSVFNTTFLNVSNGSVILRFDGLTIRGRRIDGPYILGSLTVYNQNQDVLIEKVDIYSTKFYSYTDFQALKDGTEVIPFPCTGCTTPTDPDKDGIYEDMNGNRRGDFYDVVLFFNYLEWVATNQPISNFDFNGNGRIDFNDIIKLFEEL